MADYFKLAKTNFLTLEKINFFKKLKNERISSA